jgi:hypothetical protein
MSVDGRERYLADQAASSILTAGLPGWGMAGPVTDPPITGRYLIGGSGSASFCCAAQFNVSFFRS